MDSHDFSVLRVHAFACILLMLWCAAAMGQDAENHRWLVWSAKDGGVFHNAANWSLEDPPRAATVPPSPTDNVRITGLGGTWRIVQFQESAMIYGLNLVAGRTWLHLNRRQLSVVGGCLQFAQAGRGETRLVVEGGSLITGTAKNETAVLIADAAKSEGRFALKGKLTQWRHDGATRAGAIVIANAGRGSLELNEGATLVATGGSPVLVAPGLDGRGTLTISQHGSRLTAGVMALAGDNETDGGTAAVKLEDEGLLRIMDSLTAHRSSTLMLAQGILELAPTCRVTLRGTLGGVGVIRSLPVTDTKPQPLVNHGTITLRPAEGSLLVQGFDVELPAEGQLAVALPSSKSQRRMALVLDSTGAMATIGDIRIALTMPDGGRFAAGDYFDVVVASKITLNGVPHVKLIGEGVEKFSAKLFVAKLPTGKYQGRESLRVVLTAKE